MSTRSDLKEKLVLILSKVTANCVYEVAYGSVRIKRKGGLGYLKKLIGHHTPEEKFLSSLDLNGNTIYDVGGFIGIFTIFFAKTVGAKGQVVVFEPNPENCTKIQEHIRLNKVDNVRLFTMGIGARREKRTLFVRQNNSATGSMEEDIRSQIIKNKYFKQFQVEVDTLDNAISGNNLPKPDLIKIDIEGMEYAALLGTYQVMRNYSPCFYIEIHGAYETSKLENICRIVELFQSWGYSIWHIESKQNITISNFPIAKEGHIFCKRL